ncbi:hypothetical protein Y032_0066g3733 [Ancylostoma ceylanicum]|uniref:G-protein coupled receptors family 1 profile domain-containing protein n=1 Tax=Ancylostoma ceylanicum TaxID=53326 RepID=A0A016U0J7_9BILA|nr:hypothetical protein Y032_0066g3733 [Ancylostoma ceylanicum]
MAFLLNCGIVLVVCAWPSVHFRQQLYKERISVDATALEQKSFMGFSMEHSVNNLTIFLMIDGLLMMVMFTMIGSYSAFRIRSTLKERSVSDKTINMHKKMFHTLLLQCACPTLLVYIPLCVCYAIVFASVPTDRTVTDMIGIVFLLYPLFNPIVTMLCVKDYRNFITSFVRRRNYNAQLCEGVQSRPIFPVLGFSVAKDFRMSKVSQSAAAVHTTNKHLQNQCGKDYMACSTIPLALLQNLKIKDFL